MRTDELKKLIYMKILFITLLFCFTFASLIAQDIEWQDGAVKTVDGRIFNEKISYDPEMERGVVLAKNGDQVLSLDPNDVIYFTLANEENNEQDKYYSLPLTDRNTGYTRNHYFEVLFESNVIALLSRNIVRTEVVPEATYDHSPSILEMPSVHGRHSVLMEPFIYNKLYMIDQNELELEVIDSDIGTKKRKLFKNRRKIDKKVVYSFFEGYEKEMRDYIKENMLKLRRIDDLIHALSYFSELKNQI